MTWLDHARADIKADEGLCLKPYHCPAGKLTIGYGRNIEDNGISKNEAELMLDSDVFAALADLRTRLPWFDRAHEDVRRVLLNMRYNLGWPRFSKFAKLIAACEAGDRKAAAREMRDSVWYVQVGERGERLAKRMEGSV